jgi:hypothetical protein
MNPSNAADAGKKYFGKNGTGWVTEITRALPMLTRRQRREIELGARRLVKKQMRKVKHG